MVQFVLTTVQEGTAVGRVVGVVEDGAAAAAGGGAEQEAGVPKGTVKITLVRRSD